MPPSPSGPPPGAPPDSGVDLHDSRRSNIIYYVSLSLVFSFFVLFLLFLMKERNPLLMSVYVCEVIAEPVPGKVGLFKSRMINDN